jgi:inner membrane protein
LDRKISLSIAKWLSRNYGHRTITHSIFFWLDYFDKSICRKILEKIIVFQRFFFSVLSHLIFDMVTLAGFHYFILYKKSLYFLLRNENPKWKYSTRRLFFYVFCFLLSSGFICKWSTVNNNFNDVKHQIKEYQKISNALDRLRL